MKIDYTQFEKKLKEKQLESIAFLEGALKRENV